MRLEEDHDLADRLLVRPAGGDALCAQRTDTLHLAQTSRRPLDDVEDGVAERRHQTLGVGGADALDQARSEIALDPGRRARRRHLEVERAELRAVLARRLPAAARLHVLAGGDRRSDADHGYRLAAAAQLDPQHGEPAFGVVEDDLLDLTGQRLAIGVVVGGRDRALHSL